ncbi:DEAD/DEAH box helicase [Mesoterricola sediminis]|uniref:Helicase ATP-binding domain-containing protein n=1 Tax=Mesoterricola sediminis TaxID=2927980 RepID=A0AA48GV18_9BACT|nr:DEAD/DEAH box helicase family protein [Mesoterricola sediminis]BDU78147.1 hypothetical protein METESE_31050 [Mesoterricola sediminis]
MLQSLWLPAIIFQKKHPVGNIVCLLRLGENQNIVGEEYINISPRIKEKVISLQSGDKIIVTERRKIERPDDIEGVLFVGDGESSKWLSHRLLDQFRERVADRGLGEIAEENAGEWAKNFSFSAQRMGADGCLVSNGLRPPQLGALHAIGSHWSLDESPATIVMPTGTGKTETMLATMAAYLRGPLLVVVPWDALRTQAMKKFIQHGILKKLGILRENSKNPIVGIIYKKIKSFESISIFDQCNVVICTASSLAGINPGLLQEVASKCEAVIFDEAHHLAASGWDQIKRAFDGKKILQFTATPFRRDGELVDGKVIFNYPLGTAQKDSYFKPIEFIPIFELVPEYADRAISEKAVEELRLDLENGYDHILMAKCKTVARAKLVFQEYKSIADDLNPMILYANLENISERLGVLYSGGCRIVVCVGMLGEGFDMPRLKIAAIHDMVQSLSVFLQFIGRFTRVSDANIGNAKVIGNIAEENISSALECLYSQDADWNKLLREMSSSAVREHQALVEFLANSQKLVDLDREEVISPRVLRPVYSALVYRAKEFFPKRFFNGLSDDFQVKAAWLNEKDNTLFFVTKSVGKPGWLKTKVLWDSSWDLFVLHFDEKKSLLFLASSNKDSCFGEMAMAVSGEANLVAGEQVFRSLGGIKRLIFQSMGVKKYGRRNLSYAMYTGADVMQALTVTEGAGSVKNNVSGAGWENGKRIAIGCSAKGRVWSKDAGTIPQLVGWFGEIGAKLIDDNISVDNIISNVLIPEPIVSIPQIAVLGVDWPVELLGVSEERVKFSHGGDIGSSWPLYLIDIQYNDSTAISVDFILCVDGDSALGIFRIELGAEFGHRVTQIDGEKLYVEIGSLCVTAEQYFSDYPPIVRFVNLWEMDGGLLIKPKDPKDIHVEDWRFDIWEWDGVDFKKESIWKNGFSRSDSIQNKAASYFIENDFDIVFNDDGAGEAADLVCLKEAETKIQLTLVHCKFAGSDTVGSRISDVDKVCSQAVRSSKWKWRFKDLRNHLINRESKFPLPVSRFLRGDRLVLNHLLKNSKYKEIGFEIVIVQPGLSVMNRTSEQNMVLASTATYLKETVDCELVIACSN